MSSLIRLILPLFGVFPDSMLARVQEDVYVANKQEYRFAPFPCAKPVLPDG